jgi:hypothetical protein
MARPGGHIRRSVPGGAYVSLRQPGLAGTRFGPRGVAAIGRRCPAAAHAVRHGLAAIGEREAQAGPRPPFALGAVVAARAGGDSVPGSAGLLRGRRRAFVDAPGELWLAGAGQYRT